MNSNSSILRTHLSASFITFLIFCAFMSIFCGCAEEKPKLIKPALVFGERGKKDGNFLNIDGIAVDAKGNIYVADIHRVQVFDKNGKFLYSIGGSVAGPGEIKDDVVGIAINGMNQIILADLYNYRYLVFTLDGKFIRSFGERGIENGRFIAPQGVCVDKENNIYTVDNGADTVQVFSPDGKFLFRFGKTGKNKGEFREPESITIHKDRIYVADEGNGRIQYFDLKGTYLGEIGRQTIVLRSPAQHEDYSETPAELYKSFFTKDVEGIVFDGEGFLYAANEDEGVIELFTEDGKRVGSFTSTAPGGLKKIQGLSTNQEKTNLYVCDQGNMRIQVFDLSIIRKAVLKNSLK